SGLRGLRMLVRVVLINVAFLVRTLGKSFPVAAKLVVDQVVRSKIGPLAVREFLFHFLHQAVVYGRAQVRVHLMGRGAREKICLLQLPANVGGAPERFSSKR